MLVPDAACCGHAGRAASVGFMAPKPLPDDDNTPRSGAAPVAPEQEKPIATAAGAVRVVGAKPAASAVSDDQDEDEDKELETGDGDDDEEDLVVFTAKEAAGA